MLTEDDLNHYGDPQEIYRGEGALTLSTEQLVKCRFIASQTKNGKVFLLCVTEEFLLDVEFGKSEVNSFSGLTHDGLKVETFHNMYKTEYLPHIGSALGTYLEFNANLKVYKTSELPCCRRTFTIVNLDGIDNGIDSRVSFLFHGRQIVISTTEETKMNLKRLRVNRDVLPTAELEIDGSSSLEHEIELVNEICYLLSIAVGTKVQWIAHADWISANDWIARSHCGLHVTKGYVPQPLIDLRPGNNYIKVLLEVAGHKDRVDERKLAGLTHAVIDTYLDAKAERDFIQARALKLVIAVEMLKAEFQSAREDISPLGIPEHEYGQLKNKIMKAIKKAIKKEIEDETTEKQRKIIYSNLDGLNRKTFKQQLRELPDALKLDYCNNDLNRFVASRNKLVHEGRFYCEKASDQERTRIIPFDSPSIEWFWLLHFVDRIMLKASGYKGPCLNWSTPEDPKTIML